MSSASATERYTGTMTCCMHHAASARTDPFSGTDDKGTAACSTRLWWHRHRNTRPHTHTEHMTRAHHGTASRRTGETVRIIRHKVDDLADGGLLPRRVRQPQRLVGAATAGGMGGAAVSCLAVRRCTSHPNLMWCCCVCGSVWLYACCVVRAGCGDPCAYDVWRPARRRHRCTFLNIRAFNTARCFMP